MDIIQFNDIPGIGTTRAVGLEILALAVAIDLLRETLKLVRGVHADFIDVVVRAIAACVLIAAIPALSVTLSRGVTSLSNVLTEALSLGVHIMSAFSGEYAENEIKKILGVPAPLKIAFAVRLAPQAWRLSRDGARNLLTDDDPFHVLSWVKPDSAGLTLKPAPDPAITLIAKASYSRNIHKLVVRVKDSEILKIMAGTSITDYGSVNIVDKNGVIVSSSKSELTGTPAERSRWARRPTGSWSSGGRTVMAPVVSVSP